LPVQSPCPWDFGCFWKQHRSNFGQAPFWRHPLANPFWFFSKCTIWEAAKVPGGWTKLPPGSLIKVAHATGHRLWKGQVQFNANAKTVVTIE